MNVSVLIAKRYITSRNKRGFMSMITVIAILGVMLGVASLIITLSVLDGFEKTIRRNVVSFTAHMQVIGFSNQMLQHSEETIAWVRAAHPVVTAMAPYIAKEAMARSEKGIEGVLIKGVDPANDISPARRNLVEGVYGFYQRPSGLQPIVLGRRLADKLELRLGDRMLVFAVGEGGRSLSQARVLQFEVSGIFETGMGEYDESYAYCGLQSAQRLFQTGKGVTGYDLMFSNLDSLETLGYTIPEELGYPHYGKTMFQTYRNLFNWVELQKKPIPIILGLIIMVATVNIIGTLLMMIIEKSREIGILRTIGASRKTVVRVFLSQGMFIGLTGTLLGNAAAYLLCWTELRFRWFSLPSGIYYMSHVPIDLSVFNFVLVSVCALFMCYWSSLLPARYASRLDPLTTIRFN